MRKKESILVNFISYFLFICFLGIMIFHVNSLSGKPENNYQKNNDDKKYNTGVTVSPAHIKFNVDLGKIKTKKVKVTNYTSVTKKFQIKYNDFDMALDGKSSFLEAGESKYSLSKFLSISPTFIELDPGSSAEIAVTVQLPNDPEANVASWGVLMVEEAKERQRLDPGNESGETVAFGITPTIVFGVWLYQNPPNVENTSVEIQKFSYNIDEENETKFLFLELENTGDGISFCKAYVELTNLGTGEQYFLGGKKYTILPGYRRTFIFELLPDIPKGKYSAVGVVDYFSNTKLVAAEMDLNIE